MAVTELSDVIIGQQIAPIIVDEIRTGSRLRASGAVADDAELTSFAQGEGTIYEPRAWNDLEGTPNVSSDDPGATSTPKEITMLRETVRKLERNDSWSSADLVAARLSTDPVDAVRRLIARYWIRYEEQVVVAILRGVFASASMSGHVIGTADETGSGDSLSDPGLIADGKALLGERGQEGFSALVVRSEVAAGLEGTITNPATYGIDPRTNTSVLTWNNLPVLISDSLPKVAGATSGFKYTSFALAPGAVRYASGNPKTPIELDRAPAAGNGEGVETLYSRHHFVMHPSGFRFTGTPASASPSDAELVVGTNWVRVWRPENVRVIAFNTNG